MLHPVLGTGDASEYNKCNNSCLSDTKLLNARSQKIGIIYYLIMEVINAMDKR